MGLFCKSWSRCSFALGAVVLYSCSYLRSDSERCLLGGDTLVNQGGQHGKRTAIKSVEGSACLDSKT